ncbi:hypothetical protein PROFUN_14346, partial [Planoprotostelium fungivorum]
MVSGFIPSISSVALPPISYPKTSKRKGDAHPTSSVLSLSLRLIQSAGNYNLQRISGEACRCHPSKTENNGDHPNHHWRSFDSQAAMPEPDAEPEDGSQSSFKEGRVQVGGRRRTLTALDDKEYFCEQYKRFLRDVKTLMKEQNFTSWAQLFYKRLCITETLFEPANYSSLLKKVLFYYRYVSRIGSMNQSLPTDDQELVDLNKELVKYLCTHEMDPDNSLLGLTPSRSILQLVEKHFNEADATESFNGQSLSDLIIKWSTMKDDKSIASEVRKVAASIAGTKPARRMLKRGELCIIRLNRCTASSTIVNGSLQEQVTEEDQYIFARFWSD